MDDQINTPIVPPLDQPIIPSEKPKTSRRIGRPNKFIIGISALLLLLVMPITVFYFSQKKGVTEQRSKASGGDNVCTAWSGPITITGLPGSGDYQAQTDRYDKNGTELVQAIWRGNQGWTRTVPVVNGTPNWSAASTWSGPIAITGLPGSGDYQAQSDIYIENGATLLQGVWRGNQGRTRRVPVVNGVPNFSAAGAWSNPIAITGQPGSGDYQAQTDRYDKNGTELVQAIWRGNQGWTRKVPVVNGTPNWSAASTWSGPIAITGLPGSGDYQAQSDIYINNGATLLQSIWRGNQGWTRKIPVIAGVPVFTGCPAGTVTPIPPSEVPTVPGGGTTNTPATTSCSAWSGPIDIATIPGSGDYQAQTDRYDKNGTELVKTLWRGNQGWTRTVPVVNGTPNWSAAGAFSGPIPLTGLPGTGNYQAQSDIYIENGATLLQGVWRGNQGWTRRVPVVNGVPNFNAAGAFSGPIPITNLPGSGDYQAQTDRYDKNGTELTQAIWRGNQGWTRKVPVVNGTPNWTAASTWSGPIPLTGLPGTGNYQAQSDIYIENGATLLQGVWRGNQGWTRRVPVVNGVPNFTGCPAAPPSEPPTATPITPASPDCTSFKTMYINECTPIADWGATTHPTKCQTTSPTVTIHLDAPNVNTMSFYEVTADQENVLCESITSGFSTPETYSSTKSLTLSSPAGVKKVCVKLTNAAGSAQCGGRIELLTTTSTCTNEDCASKFGSFYSCIANVCNSSLKTLPEDINGDGKVNALDYQILLNNYLKSPILNIMADVNSDGSVNALDYSRVLDKYGAGQ